MPVPTGINASAIDKLEVEVPNTIACDNQKLGNGIARGLIMLGAALKRFRL